MEYISINGINEQILNVQKEFHCIKSLTTLNRYELLVLKHIKLRNLIKFIKHQEIINNKFYNSIYYRIVIQNFIQKIKNILKNVFLIRFKHYNTIKTRVGGIVL